MKRWTGMLSRLNSEMYCKGWVLQGLDKNTECMVMLYSRNAMPWKHYC